MTTPAKGNIYYRRLEIDGSEYIVYFYCNYQKIRFLRIHDKLLGEFAVANGYITSKAPHDWILVDEIKTYLEKPKMAYTTRLTINDTVYVATFDVAKQRIEFTVLGDKSYSASFNVQKGYIASKEPHSAVLVEEIKHFLKDLNALNASSRNGAQSLLLSYRNHSIVYSSSEEAVYIYGPENQVSESMIAITHPDDLLKAAVVAKEIVDELVAEKVTRLQRVNAQINWSNSDRN